MSDYSISMVPKTSSYPEKESRAKEILEWLVSVDVVKPQLSDCILGNRGGFAVSNGARLVTIDSDLLPFNLTVNGLEIITQRQVFHANHIDTLICPGCKKNIANEPWDFLNEWASAESNNLTCPHCNTGREIHTFYFSPEWGFSDLSFTFWNWPEFKNDFIEEFKERLGCDVNVVYSRF